MAYLEIQAFQKLRAFFWALNTSNFNLSHLPPRDNQGIPVDKTYCLNLLRSFPDLQGEKFRNDSFLIKHLSQPANIKHILDQFTPAQQMEVEKALAEKPITVESVSGQPMAEETPPPAGEPASSMTEAPSLPFTPSVSSAPRSPLIIHDIPHTPGEEEKSRIHIANKSGVVEEEPPSKIFVANKGGVIIGKHQITPEPTATIQNPKPETPKLVIANKSGVIAQSPPTQIPQSKLVIANKSGIVTQPPPITPLSTRKLNFQTPGFLKNAGSALQRSFYSNIGSKITLNNALGGAGKLLQGAGGLLSGGLNASTPLLSKAGNGVVNFGVRLGNSSLGFSRSSILKPKKRIWLYALGLFMFMFGFSLFSSLFSGGDIQTGEAAPLGSGNVGIGSTNPPVPVVPIGSIPQEKLDKILYWGTTINNALEPGLPPTAWNKMMANISSGGYTATKRAALDKGTGPTGIYWCTNIVIDSYNLSGTRGLGPSHQGVRNMINFWKNADGYLFIPFNGVGSLRQVKPGYALFRLYAKDYSLDHVSLIKEINIDQRGNGKIVTLDSNSLRGWSSTIEDGKILDTFFMADIVGFGAIK